MATMTITLEEPLQRKLSEIADERGMTVDELLHTLLALEIESLSTGKKTDEDLNGPDADAEERSVDDPRPMPTAIGAGRSRPGLPPINREERIPAVRNPRSFGMGDSGMPDMARRTADEYVADPFR